MTGFLHPLGKEATDVVSGFKGIITGRAEYIAGCRQYVLTPKAKEDGTGSEGRWIDEERLTITGDGVTLAPTPKGGPAPGESAPVR